MGQSFLLVMLGGSIGAGLRYGVSILINRFFPNIIFPWPTLIVNIVGCLLIGFLVGIGVNKDLTYSSKLFLITGVLGGFTTFSAFGFETFSLIKEGFIALAVLNIVVQVLLGIAAVWLGFLLAKGIH